MSQSINCPRLVTSTQGANREEKRDLAVPWRAGPKPSPPRGVYVHSRDIRINRVNSMSPAEAGKKGGDLNSLTRGSRWCKTGWLRKSSVERLD